jgi:ubiquinone/menaquinone biosynthesis C-methylase UbiE
MAPDQATFDRPSDSGAHPTERSFPDRRDELAASSDGLHRINVGPSSGPGSNGTEDAMAEQWWNRKRYQLYAPVYDWLAKPWETGRKRAIERLDLEPDDRILILGGGTGSDLEYLPPEVDVTVVDLSPAMIRRTRERAEALDLDVDARVGDAQSLPFEDDAFDAVLLHLVLSVVPDPVSVVQETVRVLDSDGRVSIYDKFVPAEETPSLPRRMANPVAKVLFADLTRSLEPMLSGTTLRTEERETFLGGIYSVTIARTAPSERPLDDAPS